jgi:hypothetical protein
MYNFYDFLILSYQMLRYSLALSPSLARAPMLTFTHSSTLLTSLSHSSTEFPACRHTLTRLVGTVGGTTALTTNPDSWQCWARLRGDWVTKAKIGDFGHAGSM